MKRTLMEGVVKAIYDARLANDEQACYACFSTDAQFVLVGEKQAVYQAENKVPPSLAEQMTALIEVWEWQAMDIRRLVIDGNKAATMYDLKTVFKPTGEQVTTTIFDHILIGDDGKINEFIEYVDTAMIERLVSEIPNPDNI